VQTQIPKAPDEMVDEYLEHHRNPSNGDKGNMIIE